MFVLLSSWGLWEWAQGNYKTKKQQQTNKQKKTANSNRCIFVFHQLQRLKCFVKWIHIHPAPFPILPICPFYNDWFGSGKKKQQVAWVLAKIWLIKEKTRLRQDPFPSEHGEVLIPRKQHAVQRAPVRASGCTSGHWALDFHFARWQRAHSRYA